MKKSILSLMNNGSQNGWRRLSDPVIYRTLYLAAIVGCLLGLLLFAKFEANKELSVERQRTTIWARTISARAETNLLQGEALAQQSAGAILHSLEADLPADQQRAIGRKISSLLDESPASGLAVIGEGGAVLRSYGHLPATGYIWPESEVQPDQELDLLPINTANGKFIAHMSDVQVDENAHLVIVYPVEVFAAAMNEAIVPSLLFNRDGALLTASAGVQAYAGEAELDMLHDLLLNFSSPEGERQAGLDETFRDEGVVATTSIIGDGKAQVMTFLVHEGAFATLWASRTRLALLMGPALLAILLALSLIQNEWRRKDKGDDDSESMAARANIATNILSAGIIDWSIDEGSVDYSDGWAALLGYQSVPQQEEIFDWIERIHPDDRFAARGAYDDLQQGNVSEISHDIRVRTTDRKYVQVLERARMHQDSRGYRHIVLVQTVSS